MCAKLSNPRRWLRWIGRVSRQNGDRREDVHFRDRPEEVAVVLCDAAPSAISIGHESKHAGKGPRHAWTSKERLVSAAPFSTACDHRREITPFGSGCRPVLPELASETALI